MNILTDPWHLVFFVGFVFFVWTRQRFIKRTRREEKIATTWAEPGGLSHDGKRERNPPHVPGTIPSRTSQFSTALESRSAPIDPCLA